VGIHAELVGILVVVDFSRAVDYHRLVVAYALETMIYEGRNRQQDYLVLTQEKFVDLAMSCRALSGVIENDFHHAANAYEVIPLLLVIVPGLDRTRVGGGHVNLAEALEQFQYAMQQDPGHPYVRESFGFSRNTFHVWNQYHASEKREDALVQGFASSFDMAAMSLENDPDAFNRLTALRILDSGLRRLPGAQELETLPGYRKVRSRMIQRIGRLHENLSSHYSRLLVKFPDRAALQFLMGEVNRIGGWWLERPALLDQARGLLEKVLAAEPEHAAAARSLAGILHHRKKTGEIMKWVRCTTEVLLREDRTWEDRPLPAQPTRAVDLVQGVAALTGEGDAWTSLVRETWLRALEVLERQALTRQDGNSWKAWNCLGVMEARASRVLNQQDLFEKSVAHLRKAHKIRPRARSALLNLMEVLERAGRYGEVRDLKKQLEALNQGRVPPPGGRVPGAGR